MGSKLHRRHAGLVPASKRLCQSSLNVILSISLFLFCVLVSLRPLLAAELEQPHSQTIAFEKVAQLNASEMREEVSEILKQNKWQGKGVYNALSDVVKTDTFHDWSTGEGFVYLEPIWGATIFQQGIYSRIKKCLPKNWDHLQGLSVLLASPYLGPVALYDFSKLDTKEAQGYKNIIGLTVFNQIDNIARDAFWRGNPIKVRERFLLKNMTYIIDVDNCSFKKTIVSEAFFGGYNKKMQPRLAGLGLYKDRIFNFSISERLEYSGIDAGLWLYYPDQKVNNPEDFIKLKMIDAYTPNVQ